MILKVKVRDYKFFTEIASTWRASNFLQKTMKISRVKSFWRWVIFADRKSLYKHKSGEKCNQNLSKKATFHILFDD